jgi:hypothetical protein
VKTLFDYLEKGESLDDSLEGFPTVGRTLAVQVLKESKGPGQDCQTAAYAKLSGLQNGRY